MDKFESTLRYIYGSETDDTIVRIKVEIREQVVLEAEQRKNTRLGHALIELFSKKYIRRTAMAIAVLQVGIKRLARRRNNEIHSAQRRRLTVSGLAPR